ncbi:MAG TPA: hypothetical protein VIZ90_12760 [Rhizobiaceae bacterium]
MAGFDDFDFLIGRWAIANEVLKTRLVGSDEWETFPANASVEKVMPIPAGPHAGGHGGNLDTMFVPSRGFTGMSLRLFNPDTGLWSIYWSDTKSFRLFPPTLGRFENGRGAFFGDDVEGGVPVRVRFDWTVGDRPVWQQSFSTDGEKTWEKNWVMRFERA